MSALRLVLIAGPLIASTALAQGITAGATVGSVKLESGATQVAGTGIIQLAPSSWLTLAAMPSYAHLSQKDSTGASVTSSGMGDLPLSAAAATTLPGALSPELGAAFNLSLPTGNSACGLGTGTVGTSLDLGVGASLTDNLHLALGASRELSGDQGTSAFSPTQATSLSLDAEYSLTSRWTGSVSVGGDFGPADSGQALNRSIGVGGRYALAGPMMVVFDTRFGLSSGSAPWALSIGLGTAFGGTSPVSGAYSSKRIQKSLGGGSNRGSGRGKFGKTLTCS
ncbi:MAG: hypothetical protein ACHQXA_09340 [Gemmatimonadales bacterium]